MAQLWIIYLWKMRIFHSHVKSPEGRFGELAINIWSPMDIDRRIMWTHIWYSEYSLILAIYVQLTRASIGSQVLQWLVDRGDPFPCWLMWHLFLLKSLWSQRVINLLCKVKCMSHLEPEWVPKIWKILKVRMRCLASRNALLLTYIIPRPFLNLRPASNYQRVPW